MRFTFILVCLLCALDAIGQKKKVMSKVEADLVKEQSQWFQGSIELWVDSPKILGALRFNDKTQVLTFKVEGGEPETLKPNEVKRFEFFDEEKHLTRNFISVDNLDFFEIIVNTKEFSLLSKTTTIKPIAKTGNQYYYNPANNSSNPLPTKDVKIELGQEVTILFCDLYDNLLPAIRVTKLETKKSNKTAKDGFFSRFTYEKNGDLYLVDDALLSRLMGVYFENVKKYISKNNLDKNEIEDLIKIVQYYKELESNE
jgi:hypothetical protein